MIFATLAFAALLAGAQGNSSPANCTTNVMTSLIACTDVLSPDCEAGETLFEALDPATVCSTECVTTTVPNAFETAAEDGCCTYDTLYPLQAQSGSTCSNDVYLSYTGFENALEYFCSSADVAGDPYYCMSDAANYAVATGPYIVQILGGSATAYAESGINCTLISETACCYNSLTTFLGACGGSTGAETADLLTQWMTYIPMVCQSFDSENKPDFAGAGLCNGLTTITEADCLASEDPNCDGISPPGDDDDAASSMLPAFGSVLASMLAVALFTRRF